MHQPDVDSDQPDGDDNCYAVHNPEQEDQMAMALAIAAIMTSMETA